MSALWRPAYVAIGSNLDQPRERGAGGVRAHLAALPDDAARGALARSIGRARWGLRISRIS